MGELIPDAGVIQKKNIARPEKQEIDEKPAIFEAAEALLDDMELTLQEKKDEEQKDEELESSLNDA